MSGLMTAKTLFDGRLYDGRLQGHHVAGAYSLVIATSSLGRLAGLCSTAVSELPGLLE